MSSGSTRDARELLVEARVVARLLGIRLLTLDASVIVVPAPPSGRLAGKMLAPRPIGTRLAVAERLLGDGATGLAASRSRRRQAADRAVTRALTT
jgi:ribulose 1,5-bisphosphate synthetase/thiazole synthase